MDYFGFIVLKLKLILCSVGFAWMSLAGIKYFIANDVANGRIYVSIGVFFLIKLLDEIKEL